MEEEEEEEVEVEVEEEVVEKEGAKRLGVLAGIDVNFF